MNDIIEKEKIEIEEEKFIKDPCTNIAIEEDIEFNSYAIIKWDHKKQKWINARF